MTPCDSRPQHIAIGLAIPDRRNPYTHCLPAPYHVGGCQIAGKQGISAVRATRNVSSVCMSHLESRMSCFLRTVASSSISIKNMKLQNRIKPQYLEVPVGR
jgi:hypothetical protein